MSDGKLFFPSLRLRTGRDLTGESYDIAVLYRCHARCYLILGAHVAFTCHARQIKSRSAHSEDISRGVIFLFSSSLLFPQAFIVHRIPHRRLLRVLRVSQQYLRASLALSPSLYLVQLRDFSSPSIFFGCFSYWLSEVAMEHTFEASCRGSGALKFNNAKLNIMCRLRKKKKKSRREDFFSRETDDFLASPSRSRTGSGADPPTKSEMSKSPRAYLCVQIRRLDTKEFIGTTQALRRNAARDRLRIKLVY